MSKLKDKVAVITGGGSGVGKATAALFLKEGAKVVIAGRDAAKLAAVAAELKAGDALRTVPTDVMKAEQCQALIDAATKAFGRVDVLVNNATSGGRPSTGLATTPEIWAAAVEASVTAPFELCRAFIPGMRAGGKGSVINVLSTAAFAVVEPMLAYGTTKAALWTMTRYLARECAPAVRVNAICPGTVQEGGAMKVDSWARLLPLTALGRVGDSNELACAALFLASDASSYTTGQVIFVDGGRVMTT